MNKTTRKIAGTGLLLAAAAVLQLISNFVPLGPVSITLALIPIALGAMAYGPLSGAFLGLCTGALTITAPSTLQVFMNYSVFGTIFTCLIKMTLAGLIAGIIFKILKNKNLLLASILASISVPLFNTGIFVGCSFIFFMPKITELAGSTNPIFFLFIVMVGWNFLLEFGLNSLLSPVFHRLLKNTYFFNI